MKLEATETEIKQLAALLDIATKAGGLQVAPIAVQWAAKLEQAANAEQGDDGVVDFKQASGDE